MILFTYILYQDPFYTGAYLKRLADHNHLNLVSYLLIRNSILTREGVTNGDAKGHFKFCMFSHCSSLERIRPNGIVATNSSLISASTCFNLVPARRPCDVTLSHH
jgi:hypothetical protein